MKYIDAIQKETSRYYSPVPGMLPRLSLKDHYFKGVPISKGTAVAVMSIPTHFNETIYEDPLVFKPERWLTDKKESDGANLSLFGNGPRSCIGQTLALL